EGAESVVQTAVKALREALLAGTSVPDAEAWRAVLTAALLAAHNRLLEEAALREVDMQELATTLILVAATPEMVAVAQVGDGAVVAADADGQIVSLTTPQTGEYVNTTVFLTVPNALEMAQVVVTPQPVTHLAVF